MTTQTMTATRTRRRFNAAEYYAMADAGILTEADRVELLDGDVIVMAPIGDSHAFSVDELAEGVFPLAWRGQARIRVQNPLLLDDHSVPQPDIMVLQRRDDLYRSGPPGPGDVLLLIEVSGSSLYYDRNAKLAAYARAGIPEVWIANLPDHRVETYANPVNDGYSTVRHYGSGESVAPQAFPDIALEVDRIIGG